VSSGVVATESVVHGVSTHRLVTCGLWSAVPRTGELLGHAPPPPSISSFCCSRYVTFFMT
jgi:hypothetical protein